MNDRNILKWAGYHRNSRNINVDQASDVVCLTFSFDVSPQPRRTFILCTPVSSVLRRPEIFHSCIETTNKQTNKTLVLVSAFLRPCTPVTGLSHPLCTESCMATGGGRLPGMREGPTVPRVLLAADPTYFSSLLPSLRFRIPQIRINAHKHNLIHTPIRTRAALRSYASAVRTLPFLSISSLISLQTCIDHLRHMPADYDSFSSLWYANSNSQQRRWPALTERERDKRGGVMRGRSSSDV